jgi:hypothetical protein
MIVRLAPVAVALALSGAGGPAAGGGRVRVPVDEIERRGVYDIMGLYIDEMCIKEVPFFLALHRCYAPDPRLAGGATLMIDKLTILQVRDRASREKPMRELLAGDLNRLDSVFLYKEPKNRRNRNLCNFIAYVDPGSYAIPRTGASVVLPRKVFGSIYHHRETGKMVVYVHCDNVHLKLPLYAKALSLGMLDDLDIGFAELEQGPGRDWTARLLYRNAANAPRRGWKFNVTACKKIRPYSD